jgi:hypothetical protein
MRRQESGVAAAALGTARECVALSGELVPIPDAPGVALGRPETGPASTPPWNAAAAYAHTDLAEVARRLEVSLLNQVEGHKPRARRGGATSSTYAALRAVGVLLGRVEKGDAARAAGILLRVAAETQRLNAVDTITRWVRIRPSPGHRPPLCPYCRTFSLRRAEGTYSVMCFGWVRDPETGEQQPCTDSDGQRPKAQLDISRLDGTPVLAFRDGLVIGRGSLVVLRPAGDGTYERAS